VFRILATLIPSVGAYQWCMYHDAYLDTKKASSTKYHENFLYSISISITDTFQVYPYHNHWYMTVIHLLEFATLLTRFHPECVRNFESISDSSSYSLQTHRGVEDDFFDYGHNTINWRTNQCCRQGMYTAQEKSRISYTDGIFLAPCFLISLYCSTLVRSCTAYTVVTVLQTAIYAPHRPAP